MAARDILLGVFTALIWGLNFVVIKVGLSAFPPLLFSALRFSLAAVPAVFFIDRRQIPWRVILEVGVVLGVIKYSLLFSAMKVGMPAGLSSLVLQSQVLFTMLLAAVFLGDKPSRSQKIGISLAFGGIALIACSRAEGVSSAGFALVMGAALAWAVANLLIKRAGKFDAFRLMVWMSLIPPLPLFFLSSIFERGQLAAISSMGVKGLFAIIYTGLIATVMAFGIWGRLLRRYSVNLVTPFALLVPVSGMGFSALLLHERSSWLVGLAALMVLAGLATIVYGAHKVKA
jgi:O-acetylserine/cysteine efflux transporter